MVDNLQTLKGIYKKKSGTIPFRTIPLCVSPLINSLAYPPPQSLQYVQVGQLSECGN